MDCGFFFAWILANLTKISHTNCVLPKLHNHSGML